MDPYRPDALPKSLWWPPAHTPSMPSNDLDLWQSEFVIRVKRDLKRCQKFRTIWSLKTSKKIFLHMLSHCVPLRSELNFKDVHEGFKACFFTHQIVQMTRSDKAQSCLFGIRHVLFGPFSGLTFSQLQGKGCKGSSKDSGIRTSLWVTR